MRLLTLIMTTLFCLSTFALPTFSPQLVLQNQQGEVSVNAIKAGSTFIGSPVATHTILANLTGSTAAPTAASYASVQSALGISALQNGTFTLQTETVSAAGALSISVAESLVTNASGSTFAVTLAAPSSQDGQIKVIKAVTSMAHTITLSMANISISGGFTGAGTATLTFTSIGDSAIFMAVGSKWVYLGGSAVAS